jgi:hypothetical protein
MGSLTDDCMHVIDEDGIYSDATIGDLRKEIHRLRMQVANLFKSAAQYHDLWKQLAEGDSDPETCERHEWVQGSCVKCGLSMEDATGVVVKNGYCTDCGGINEHYGHCLTKTAQNRGVNDER